LSLDIMLDLIIRVAVLLVTGFLFLIMITTYLRMRGLKMLLISLGFGILFLHSILLMPELMIENYTMGFTENLHLLIHLLGMLSIALGILKD
jgi:hypothetical protein